MDSPRGERTGPEPKSWHTPLRRRFTTAIFLIAPLLWAISSFPSSTLIAIVVAPRNADAATAPKPTPPHPRMATASVEQTHAAYRVAPDREGLNQAKFSKTESRSV